MKHELSNLLRAAAYPFVVLALIALLPFINRLESHADIDLQ